MSKEAYYFSHDANARQDDKILELRAEFGWEGYGLYWAIIETLRDSSNYTFPSNAKAGLSLSLNIGKDKLEKFLNFCFDVKLLVNHNGVFYSESLMRRMEEIDEKRRKRAEAGRLGGNAKAMAKQRSGNALAKSSKESKAKESKINKNKEEESKSTSPSGEGSTPTNEAIKVVENAISETEKASLNDPNSKAPHTGGAGRGAKEKAHLFKDSEYFDLDAFKSRFTGPEYDNVNLAYYHRAVANWSASGGNKKIDWIATARGFMNRDEKEGKLAIIKVIPINQPKKEINYDELAKEYGTLPVA